MARRYFVPSLPGAGVHALPDETAHHVIRVLRARVGERIELFDGRGGVAGATLTEVGRRRAEARFEAPRECPRVPEDRIELAFALPKGQRAEWLFEHGTEIGVAAFRPVLTERAEAGRGSWRADRWERITQAAAGQCGQTHLPTVHEPVPLDDFLTRDDLPDDRRFGAAGAPPLTPTETGHTLWLVGPPGGFSDAEIERTRAAGFVAHGLGGLILRTETAAIAGAVRLFRRW